MKVTVKKVGDEFRLYVATPVMGDQPAGLRLQHEVRHIDFSRAARVAQISELSRSRL